MKAIVCEMCSSHDVVKQDGYYVCQSCGTKYSTEDAKKLMVEIAGKVDVSGSTVSVDTTDATKRSLENARRAMQKEDWEEAEKYYNLVEQNDPSNIEAIFYSAYAKAKATLVVDDVYRREAVFKSFCSSISIVDDNFDVDNEESLRPLVDKMVSDIIKMAGSEFIYTVTRNGNGVVTGNNSDRTYRLFGLAEMNFAESLTNIGKKLKDADKNAAAAHYYRHAKTLYNAINGEKMYNFTSRTVAWSTYKDEKLNEISESVRGLDNDLVFEIYQITLEEYDSFFARADSKKEVEYWSKRYTELFVKMKEVRPSFDSEAELAKRMGKSKETVAKNKAKKTVLWVCLFVLIPLIIGGIIGLIIWLS